MWTWRCATENRTSRNTFTFYYDCVSDAREHGYHVELTQGCGAMAPGGPDYAAHSRMR